MFKWSPYPFLRLSIAIIIGILLYEIPFLTSHVSIYPIMLFFPLMALFVWLKHRLWSGIIGILLFISIGLYIRYLDDPTRWDHHISHHQDLYVKAFSGQVTGHEVEKEKYFRYEIDINQVMTSDGLISLSGKIHLYLYKSDDLRLTPGDLIYVNKAFFPIANPSNPAEFDYSSYIKRSHIYGQSFAHQEDIHLAFQGSPHFITQVSYQLRSRSRDILNKVLEDTREQQIAQALLIGVKDYLDQEVKTAYASVGAMHVLAVSGLHVGIVYIILLTLLKPLRLVPYGSFLVFSGLILGIWFYALITGMSPSVMRAATMFSVVSLKEVSIKRSNIYNSLGLAAMVILLLKPQYLFAVGFQLSFIAVFGIVYIYPRLYQIFTLKSFILDKIWSISCISIAAQVATFPLSIFYFNQFPTYFLISNLLVIPGATMLLIVGLLTILTGFILPDVAIIPGSILKFFLWVLNEGIFLIEGIPNSLISGLYITGPEVVLCYTAIVLVFMSLEYRSFMTMSAATLCFVMQLAFIGYRNLRSLEQRRIVFYEIKDKTAFDLINGREATFLVNDFLVNELELLQYQVNPYRRTVHLDGIENNIQHLEKSEQIRAIGPLKLLLWNDKKIIILDQNLEDYDIIPMECDVLLLTNDAILDPTKLTESFLADQILVSSDYSSRALRKLINNSRKEGIQIHSLTKDGHWMLDLNQTPSI